MVEIQKENIQNQALYISFNKNEDNVLFPAGISEEDIVTIVLQNQFWDLSIDQSGFEVVLDFFGEKHAIYVTFESIVLLVDPVQHFYIDLRDLTEYNSRDFEIEENGELFDDDKIIEVDLNT